MTNQKQKKTTGEMAMIKEGVERLREIERIALEETEKAEEELIEEERQEELLRREKLRLSSI